VTTWLHSRQRTSNKETGFAAGSGVVEGFLLIGDSRLLSVLNREPPKAVAIQLANSRYMRTLF